jgi:hypothetical protein
MDQQLYTTLVTGWAEHLTNKRSAEFDELLELSETDVRLRNVFGLYAISSEDTFRRFLELSNNDRLLKQLRYDVVKAFNRLEREDDKELSDFANKVKSKYFNYMKPLVEENIYDVSAEMAKLVKTMVNSYKLSNSNDLSKGEKLNKRLSEFNLSVLN